MQALAYMYTDTLPHQYHTRQCNTVTLRWSLSSRRVSLNDDFSDAPRQKNYYFVDDYRLQLRVYLGYSWHFDSNDLS